MTIVSFLKEYWWIIFIVLLGLFINAIKALNKTHFNAYLKKKNPNSASKSQDKK